MRQMVDVMLIVSCVVNEERPELTKREKSFKAYLARWMAATTKMAPETYDAIMGKLRPSAIAAAQQCSGGDNGRTCGLRWTKTNGSVWDGTHGVGQQMAALEVVQSTLIHQVAGPVTNSTGGTSEGNAAAGGKSVPVFEIADAHTGDRVGAWVLTVSLIVIVSFTSWWMIV